jgi:hypothetical protein
MSFDIIKNLFITLSITIILFISASSFYLVRSNYHRTIGFIEESNCTPIPTSNSYSCILIISYLVKGNNITNRLIINSNNPYKPKTNINIEYDENNYLNISLQSEYKQIALLSGISGIIFMITTIIIYNEIKKDINELLSYIPNFG